MSNNPAGFIKDVGNEMKRVSWPDKQQLQEATIVTVMVCLIITAFVFVVDRAFTFVMGFIFDLV